MTCDLLVGMLQHNLKACRSFFKKQLEVEQHEAGEPIIIARSTEITSLLVFTHMDPHLCMSTQMSSCRRVDRVLEKLDMAQAVAHATLSSPIIIQQPVIFLKLIRHQ